MQIISAATKLASDDKLRVQSRRKFMGPYAWALLARRTFQDAQQVPCRTFGTFDAKLLCYASLWGQRIVTSPMQMLRQHEPIAPRFVSLPAESLRINSSPRDCIRCTVLPQSRAAWQTTTLLQPWLDHRRGAVDTDGGSTGGGRPILVSSIRVGV